MKRIKVTISQTLSSNQEIIVSDDFDENDNLLLEQKIIEQIILPTDCLDICNKKDLWIVDDFCVL